MMRRFTALPRVSNLLVLLVGLSTFAYAGNGRFQGGAYDFCVSVRFNATAAELQQIRTAFQNASQIFADATNGQQRFGTITIVNDSGASQSADYWVNPGSGRAYATYGQYGVRGQHVNLFFLSNFQATNGANGDAYTIAHEHAHHSFSVADEYSGPGGAAECAATPDTAALSFCLMDNYFTRGGNAFASGYTLNEFCVGTNHDPDLDTYQQSINSRSCWQTIAAHPRRSATAPVGLPADAAPAAHTVNFVDGFGGLRVMLLLDRSGSMSLEQRLDFAKQSSTQFINLLQVGDGLGVASFSDTASVNFPLTTIVGATTQSSAQTAVNSLVASGATNIGGGLLTALGQLTGQTQRSCNEVIVLLSDGDHNTGTAPAAALPALLAAGVTVFTVGVGSGISAAGEATLQSIATQTGGRYFRVSNSFELTALFTALAAETTGNGLLTRSPQSIASGELKEVLVPIEQGVASATFAVTLANSADAITLSLQTPSGVIITAADASTNPNIKFLSSPNSRTFQVLAPEAGTWKMRISAGTITTGILEVLAFADHAGVQLNVTVKNNTLNFPEPVEIQATPTFGGESVTGATVAGTVIRPDGSKLLISLFDDGLPEHADAVREDGIYSTRFNKYNSDGTYIFELTVTNSDGTTFSGEDLFLFAPSNAEPAPPFIRTSSTTVVLAGVPSFVVATVEFGPEVINLRSNGRFMTGYIELPNNLNPADIVVNSVAVTAIDNNPIALIPATPPSAIGDFDTDLIPDLMVKFDRASLQRLLSVGMRRIRLEGVLEGGRLFVGERSVGVINPGR